eukprot:UN01118
MLNNKQQRLALSEDLRALRAAFHLQQWHRFDQELSRLPSDVPSVERGLWVKRGQIERNLQDIASQTEPPAECTEHMAQFQHHIANLYAIFCLSPMTETRQAIFEQVEQYLYDQTYYNDVMLQIYGGLICCHVPGKMYLAKELWSRETTPEHSIYHAEWNLEKLYLLSTTLITYGLLDRATKVMEMITQHFSCEDDIIYQSLKLDILAFESSSKAPLLDFDQDGPIYTMAQDILAEHGPAVRPLFLQALDLMKRHQYKNAFNTLKQARQCAESQGMPPPAGVFINSIHCLWAYSHLATHFYNTHNPDGAINAIIHNTTAQNSFIQQQKALKITLDKLEADLTKYYPQHPFLLEKANIQNGILTALAAANIPTIQEGKGEPELAL